ncbi:extracellular solute-binding protein family 1 [Thermoclostridium stercorarium subsp. stercorarium DSM 8532]|uniref:Extracellular solute-binding protein family 1 n=2 Tax=Thermoclostridium stercorarium TaxID=1510 RepID=L7VS50_THES1|nr:ABC transporter substrate-binding protein [Thermoclostridium stercorarium]AGC69602.1 extracellular solute-binding protein family 1 [Thermoclostridium stercorarium subsp. stercorarium DSM 8532]AGI40553.1 ABC transporter periplasmic subunit [Thermoclostridium stercorarium subsp. stercorarium DSM 8532]ANW99831.1 ABC transporter substrate-binding protein [Thermoclostridium stercorarium subsp. thermolacticum DSM 2910]
MLKGKRIFSFPLIMLLALALILTGCTSRTSTPEGGTTVDTGNDVKTPTEEPTVTLTWYLVGNRQEPDTPKVLAEANKYLKDKLNVAIDLYVFGWGDEYDQKVNTALAAGEPIDIVFTANWAANYNVNAASGYFTELNGYLEKYPAIKQILGEDFLNGSAINGKNYALPTNKEKVHNWGWLLRKDLVEKYNMDISNIKTIEAIEPLLKIIKENEPDIIPLCIATMDAPFQLLDWDRISDDDVPGALYPDNRDTKIINHFLAPESIEHYHLMRDWMNKGYIHPDAATMQNQVELMKSGKYFAASQSLKPGKDAEMSATTGIEWVQVDVTRPVMSNRETTGAMLAIPKASKNPEKAFLFIELLYTDKYLKNLLNYGIENVHYRKINDNVIELINPENSGYNPGHGWKFGDQFKDYLMSNEDPQKWEKFLKFNEEGLVLNSLGFVFDKTNVETQISACKNVVQAYYKQLFTGSVEVEPTVEQFAKELKAAGVDELIAEMQRQYDEWLKNKPK